MKQTLAPSLEWNMASAHGTTSFSGEASTIPLWPPEEAKGDKPLTLGVVWYLVPDENHNSDGKYIHYLNPSAHNQERYRDCDPILYDAVRELVHSNRRSVRSIQDSHILPLGTQFHDAVLTFNRADGQGLIALDERVARKNSWLSDALRLTAGCDLVFVDPDNGFEVKVGPYQRCGPKYVFFDELLPYLEREQSLIVYHHIGRQGSASNQIQERLSQIRSKLGSDALALLYHRGSARAFFVVPAPQHRDNLIYKINQLTLSPWSRHFEVSETLMHDSFRES